MFAGRRLVSLWKKRHSQDKIETKYSLEWNVTEFRWLGVTFSVDLNNMSKLNFDLLIEKINKILNQWRRRSLTPLGKITVLKTLILSFSLIYCFTFSSRNFLKEFKHYSLFIPVG